MVQRKTCKAIESYNLQPETRFGQEHLKILGPEMMMMKRTKLKRKLKDTVSQSGKSQPSQKHDLVVKVTGRSPNYMKGTTSSEARKENKERSNLSRNQKNQVGPNHVSRHNKPSSRIVRSLTKAPSFKRCASQRATCSSTLKDSKFPNYLMLNNHGETYDEVRGTSVLKVCPYTYCSLNGHLHSAQHPPLKSFISSKRRSLKTQKSMKREASTEEFMEMYVEEKKECEDGNGGTYEIDVDSQKSETISEGAPRSEIDSDGAEMVKISEVELKESDMEETLVDVSAKEIQETCEVDAVSQIEEAPCSEVSSDDYSDRVEMVKLTEGDHSMEETLVDDSVKEIPEKGSRDGNADQSGCFDSEVIGMMNHSAAHNASKNEDDAGEETLKDVENCKEESQDRIEVISMIEETTKVPYIQEESDANISWTITKCTKPKAEIEHLREFNPREPNYLPLVADADTEKVDLKHQDLDDRKNSEDWMVDYALQCAVTKLSSARKRKVALLVEAFETVQPVMPNGREPAQDFSYGRHLQACN